MGNYIVVCIAILTAALFSGCGLTGTDDTVSAENARLRQQLLLMTSRTSQVGRTGRRSPSRVSDIRPATEAISVEELQTNFVNPQGPSSDCPGGNWELVNGTSNMAVELRVGKVSIGTVDEVATTDGSSVMVFEPGDVQYLCLDQPWRTVNFTLIFYQAQRGTRLANPVYRARGTWVPNRNGALDFATYFHP